jgi:transcription elongation factor SPT5
MQDIKPNHEELQNFQDIYNKTNLASNPNNDDQGEDEKLEAILREALMKSGSSIFAKGDKISINRGDFNGLKGIIETRDDNQISFKALNIPQLTQTLTVETSFVSKYFEPGDMIRVVEGKYKGDTGKVIGVDEKSASVMLDVSQQEIKIRPDFLKLKNDSDMNLVAALNVKKSGINGGF